MIVTTLTVQARSLRLGDRTHFGTFERLDGYVKRGPSSGALKVVCDGKETRVAPDLEFDIYRDVPTAEEREEYRDAAAKFQVLTDLVDARREVCSAAKRVRANMQDVLDSPHPERYHSVLGQAGPEIERYNAKYATLVEIHGWTLEALGYDLEHIDAWAVRGRVGDGVLRDGRVIPSLYSLNPKAPRNVDCYLDGTPAWSPSGGRYTVAPLTPADA